MTTSPRQSPRPSLHRNARLVIAACLSTLALALTHAQTLSTPATQAAAANQATPQPGVQRFVFGPAGSTAPAMPGTTLVAPDARYDASRGHGFDAPAGTAPALPVATTVAVSGPRQGQPVLSPAAPVFFSLDLPEGSWRVTLTLGGTAEASDTTVRAELRRLVLQNQRSAPGQTATAQFTVHVRRPEIPAGMAGDGGRVALREPREAVGEVWNWDGKLTLEINGAKPVVQAITVAPVQVPLLFVLGDSTVADQAQEPYASWGQMLPRWLGPGAAVVSLAQSGETYRDALARRRLDKIVSLARPGDVVLMQYGHNDQKQLRDGSGSVASYQDEMRQHVRRLRAVRAVPVIVTPVERRFFEPDGSLRRTLTEHADAARAVAAELQVPLIDLNASSRTLYLAYGPQQAPRLFAHGADGRIDPTHHANEGAWLLAGLVAQGLRELKLPLAAQLRADAPALRAEAPPALATLAIVPSPSRTQERPAGDTDSARAPAAAASSGGAAAWSAERLARVDAAVQDEIDRGRLAGAVVQIHRDGRLVHQTVRGLADREQQRPMQADTLFRIASMSKAVTTVAAMMLYEEGRFLLRDPIAKWLPAFAEPQVAVAGAEGQPPRLEKARRPITVRDLLLHTAGLSYGAGPAEAQWKAAGFSDWYILGRDETLAQWTDRLARLPLQAHPGEVWQYGYSTDVLGRLVELWSGMPFDRFVAERITGPLKMADTHFWVPRHKAARLAHVYGLKGGQLTLEENAARSDFIDGPRKLPSGGAGLVSTAGDYARFLQMLLSGGQLDGVRLLSPASVAMMSRDHVSGRYSGYGGDGEGAGFGFWVQASPGSRSELGSPGAYGWGSAYAPQYLVDPQQRLLVVFMTQLRPAGDSTLNQRIKVLVRQALME
ncbi:serine hydrolase [Aquabacterium sp. OR-4]|uniref:serine hydrolase n=1 Tax=Aquabacterium sp. OR-4 TaxID=2978127 RepID=UPI0028C70F6C|nr:serine hydrolase [Aquabacterium sp. OR-4]MDT7838896.1 serine hydrolase [Aquabacterium sp. OR-4]